MELVKPEVLNVLVEEVKKADAVKQSRQEAIRERYAAAADNVSLLVKKFNDALESIASGEEPVDAKLRASILLFDTTTTQVSGLPHPVRMPCQTIRKFVDKLQDAGYSVINPKSACDPNSQTDFGILKITSY